MNIVITGKQLRNRGTKGRTLLKPLTTHRPTGPAFDYPSGRKYDKVIGYFDGSSKPDIDYRDWRFKTFVKNIRGMYFELWKPVESGRDDKWYLDRAYLSLYRYINYNEESEIICLHCDPNEPKDGKHYRYKIVPHLHIKASEEPIPHAHIALELSGNQKLIASVDDMFSYFHSAIFLIKHQILDRM